MLPSRKPVLRAPVLRRQSVYRITGEAKNEAKAKAGAKAEAKAEAKWSSARELPWVLQVEAVGGQVPPLWCGCCSSPTPVLGAAGPGST